MIKIEKFEKSKVFAYLSKYHLIDKLELRNLKIRSDHRSLVRETDFHEAIFLLSEKYGLSNDTIRSILYRKEKQKSQ